MTFYTYLYIDPSKPSKWLAEGEPIYVGKGKKGRAWQHTRYTHNPHFRNRLAKMKSQSVEPIVKLLVEGVDEELAILVEVEAIAKFGRRDIQTGCLTNLTNGGDGTSGHRHTVKSRKKMSESHKKVVKTPEWNAKVAAALKNKPHTEQRKRNIGLSRAKPCTVDGITIFESLAALAKALGYGKEGTRHPNFRYCTDPSMIDEVLVEGEMSCQH